TKLAGDLTGKWIYNVHRLDSKTSGVIILAFSSEIAHELTLQFERKEVSKTYYAVVQGIPGDGVFNDKVLVKKKTKFKKSAITHFKTLNSITTNISYKEKENINLSLVEIHPETGRWHQIRQHFARNRFDILGDSHHGDFTLNKIVTQLTGIKRLYLHAEKIEFIHPITTTPIKIVSEIPAEFNLVFQLPELNQ
ncbi:MAG TPA: pseudouridine synthase, partial [Draconibacterium sp.]|nr:pseudouridine synthase [Draconibacterium sp.]